MMTKTGLFFISDYRDVSCKPGRDPAYWILKELDKNDKFKVYSTANKVVDSSCFKNIEFLTLGYKGDIQIQKPGYNYRIYKAYKKVKDEVKIIHHCEKFQVGKGYNLIPILSDTEDKALIIGPIEVPHEIFEDDFLSGTSGIEKFSKKLVYHWRDSLGKVFKHLFEKTIEQADTLIVCDTAVKRELSKYISHKKIEVIDYSVDVSVYRGHEYRADENNYDIVYAGAAIKRKGVNYLLWAVSIVKKFFSDVKLHIRAGGYRAEEYRRIIKDLDISENVIFHDRLELNEYLDLISKCRLLCLPTLADNYCYIVLDALCLGVPVVVTDVCSRCSSDLFENGDIGIIVEPGSSEQLADAILKLFNDFELCKKFSKNGLKKREKFDHKKTIPKYIKLYEKYI